MTGFAQARRTIDEGEILAHLEERQPSRAGPAPASASRDGRPGEPGSRGGEERRGARPFSGSSRVHAKLRGRRFALEPGPDGRLHARLPGGRRTVPAGGPAGPERRPEDSRHVGWWRGRGAGSRRGRRPGASRGRGGGRRGAERLPRARGRRHGARNAPAHGGPGRPGGAHRGHPRDRRIRFPQAPARAPGRVAPRRAPWIPSAWRRRPPCWPTAAISPRN